MTLNQKAKLQSLGDELVEILIRLTDEEKSIAIAMMRGMAIGKKIAEQNQNKTA